jgi:hypothetical protein
MKIIDILFLIYLCLVLLSVVAAIAYNPQAGFATYILLTLLIICSNHLILGIFNINYLNSNDNTIKRIINILIGLCPILITVVIIIKLIIEIKDEGNENSDEFSNTKTSLMEKLITRLNNFIKK